MTAKHKKIKISAKKQTPDFYRAYARHQYHEPGYIEFEEGARVRVVEGGAYVQGWVFISEDVGNVRGESD